MYRTLLYTILGYLSGSLLFAKFFSRLLDGEDVTAESPDKNPGVLQCFSLWWEILRHPDAVL